MTKNQDAIRRLFNVYRDTTGNLPTFPGIFPDYPAPVIRMSQGERELTLMRWGMPPPPHQARQSPTSATPSLRIGEDGLDRSNRCLVPVTSFSEYAPEKNPATGKKDVVWFSIDETRPLFAFAGIWTPWIGARGTKSKPVEGDRLLYGFLTTEPNAVVRPIHPKAMPVILHERDWEAWLTAPATDALTLQQPWPDDQLKIVKRGSDKDDVKNAGSDY